MAAYHNLAGPTFKVFARSPYPHVAMTPTIIPSPTVRPNPDEHAQAAPPERKSGRSGLWSKVPDPIDSELEKVLNDYLRDNSTAA